MTAPVRETLVVAAAVVDDLDAPTRLLACRRTAPSALAGRWEFPGGKVEPDEDPIAALHRELYEELGVRVRLGAEVHSDSDTRWPLGDGLTMRLWTAVTVAGDPRPLEDHDELRWLPRGRWHDVDWLPADVAVVDQLQSGGVPTGVPRGRTWR